MLLQQALNMATTVLPRLVEDAMFGIKTRARVIEFQGQQMIGKDGVVGPITWGMLEVYVESVKGYIDQYLPPSGDEAETRKRIVNIALTAFSQWGWGADGRVKPDGSMRIAAARGHGPSVMGKRPRQGGVALAAIYEMAGVGGANCVAISQDVEALYQTNPQMMTPAEAAARREKLNNDIGSWCGIFATYCYRAAGLKVNWHDVKTKNSNYFEKLNARDPVKAGDIGNYDPVTNHHFLVAQDAAAGEAVHLIDGKLSNPSKMVVAPWNSVITKRRRERSALIVGNGNFLRPRFDVIGRT